MEITYMRVLKDFCSNLFKSYQSNVLIQIRKIKAYLK